MPRALGGSAGVTSSRETVTDQVTINLETTGEKNTQLLSFKFLWTNRLGTLPGIEDLLARLAQQLATIVSLILIECTSVMFVYQIKLLLVNLVNSYRPSGHQWLMYCPYRGEWVRVNVEK